MRDAARRPLAPAVCECAFNTHAVVHAPAEVLIEGLGFGEHPVHFRDAVEPPVAQVLVERRGA